MVAHFARFYPHPDDPAAVINRVGLTDKATARTHTLSGGQKRREIFIVATLLFGLDLPDTGAK